MLRTHVPGRRFMTIWPKTRLTRIALVLASAFLFYSATTYFGAPAVIRYLAQNQAATILRRRVSVGRIKFNPYRLRLVIADLRVAGRDGSQHFIDVGRIDLRLSWTSLSHLAVVIKELTVERPSIRVARLGPQTFDFSDLLSSLGQRRTSSSSSLLFAVSNIEVKNGVILFDDHVLKKVHRLANIRLAIPFIANLPTDADNYVQPMLQMMVDGSPFTLTGKTKPFRGNLESIIELSFQKVDIIPFAGYVPYKLPFKLKQAQISAALQLHFIQASGHPQLQIGGTAALENVAISNLTDSPLAELKQLRVVMAQVEPLGAKVHLSSIGIDSLSPHLVVNHDGTTNLASLLGAPWAQPSASSQTRGAKPMATQSTKTMKVNPALVQAPALLNPMAVAPSSAAFESPSPTSGLGRNTNATANSHFSLTVDSLELNNSTLDITDRSQAVPTFTKLQAIHLGLKNFANVGETPASYNFNASLNSGGRLAANGSFNLSSSQATSKLACVNVDLPSLQGFMAPVLAASIVSGKFSAQVTVRAAFGGHFNVHAQPAQLTIDQVELRPPGQAQSIVGWKHFTTNIDQFDLASHQVVVRELRGEGMHVTALRDSHNNLNLASLFRGQLPFSKGASAQATAGASSSPWQYRIESLVLESADAAIEDDARRQQFSVHIVPLNIRVNGMTNDFAKPFGVEADGNLAGKGSFKLAGQTAINPFQGRFHIDTKRIDLAWADPLIVSALGTSKLNAKITKAELAMNGDAEAQFRNGKFDALYRGDVTFRTLRMVDRLTGVSFLRAYALSLNGLEMRYGRSKPRIQIAALAASNFYARLILNADGRLNLRDIVTSPEEPSTPITQPSVRPSRKAAAAAFPADITVGSFTLQNGEINYLDNFIKPNYSAVVTHLDGKIGAFGTNGTETAGIVLAGKVNGTSPVSISGSINPLAPMASLDLQANASRIELAPLTPYATRYTGYPIIGGTLTGNVHYILAHRHLTATNHIILDQLSFGDRVESSSVRNLPVRLAVAVLKDSQGRIDLRIPVSGSLADPDFDLGRIIWQGLLNVIMKAAASPFTVLASAIGGEAKNLAYVEFAPGYSTLTQPERNKLETLAALLEQRPWLKLQISGRVDPRVDRQGLREALLEDEIKRRKAEDRHQNTALVAIEQVEVTPDEYNKYLWQIYKAADFAKPRDLVGMVKRLPPDEMKKLLLANIKVSDEDLRHLAEARAAAVYQALKARIAQSRLLVGAPKLNTGGVTEGPTTRADFSLN